MKTNIKTLKIATRKSPLALWQAEFVASQIKKHYPNLEIELVKMVTTGDKILNQPLAEIGGKALFIKELEKGMMDGEADIAVHSMKDVPFELPQGFKLGAILERENPFDAFVSNNYKKFLDLPKNAIVGSCSMRRIVQLKKLRPDIKFIDLRGNVNTRLQKLDNGDYDAIILACAGLIRLGFEDRIASALPIEESLPAVGQGAVGIEIKTNDSEIQEILKPLIDEDTTIRVDAERAMNYKLKGSCQSAIACFATLEKEQIKLIGLVGDVNSGLIIKEQVIGAKTNGQQLGEELADKLLSTGADKILNV
jgi:hydroxymethylbilane synthase